MSGPAVISEAVTAASAGDGARRPARRSVLETFATTPASRGQWLLAAIVCAVAAIGSIATLTVATAPMPAVPGFLAIHQCALVLVYALTSWVFFKQYGRTRAPALLVLGAGSFYTTLIVLAQLVCMPNILRPGLILGQGPATLTWLWNFWHLAPPLFAIPYAIMEGDGRPRQTAPRWAALSARATLAAVLAAAGLTVWVTTNFVHALPVTSDPDGGYWALTTSGIGPIIIVLTVLALTILCWTTRLRTLLQLWMAVSLLLLLLDNLVTDVAASRATMGWFIGRVEALLAGIVVLYVYLRELDSLYRGAELAAVARDDARAEAEAARAELDIALEASGMAEWKLDIARGSSVRSARHDRIFGYAEPQGEWDWSRFLEHVVPEDRERANQAFNHALRGGKLELECRIRRAGDNGVRWIAMHGRTSLDERQQPVCLAGCLLDVTERHVAEERNQQADRLEAVGQLTGGLAHDFNNLLTVILGNIELLLRRPGEAARVERLANSMYAAARRGSDLTDKLLAFSRRQAVKPETIDLNRLAGEFKPLLQQAVGGAITVELDLDPALGPVLLDASQIQAALLNLAGNARDAMPSGGQLRLETRNVILSSRDAAALPNAAPGSYLLLRVVDTGTGMDPATAERAFEPFFTTKDVGKGTGLGLSQVYGFVRQAGGSLRIVSAPGQGCTVELYLPRSTAPVAMVAEAATTPLRRAINGEVVLIVEDEDSVREMAAESLDGLGYGVLTAPDARVALEILRGPSRVDIMFSDVVMPGGMNGAQLAHTARTIRPDMKVLLTSGYTVTATGGARELPPDVPLLRKPYMRDDLAEQLQSVLATG